jgi:hypothetical protein
MNENALILNATFELHDTINGSDAFCGYDGSTEAFANLLKEVEAIVNQLIPPDLRDVDNVVETWFEVQNSIGSGELEVDWFHA